MTAPLIEYTKKNTHLCSDGAKTGEIYRRAIVQYDDEWMSHRKVTNCWKDSEDDRRENCR
jgi:hypothetical protein